MIPHIPQLKAKGVLLWWGKVRWLYGIASFYIGAIQLVLIALMAYQTTVRDWALQYLGWEITLWQYLGGLVIVSGIGFMVEYVVSVPALIAVGNEQAYKHDSPIKADFEEIKAELKKLTTPAVEVASISVESYKEVIEIKAPVRFYWGEDGSFDGIEFGPFRAKLQPWELEMIEKCCSAQKPTLGQQDEDEEGPR